MSYYILYQLAIDVCHFHVLKKPSHLYSPFKGVVCVRSDITPCSHQIPVFFCSAALFSYVYVASLCFLFQSRRLPISGSQTGFIKAAILDSEIKSTTVSHAARKKKKQERNCQHLTLRRPLQTLERG